jgi:hypothetical protein
MTRFDDLRARTGQRARRQLLALAGRRALHLLHIGKTGGTAINHAFRQQPKTKRFRIYRHEHRTTLRDVARGELVVFFLRDPVSRFVSGFYSRQRQGQPRIYVPWSASERAAFNRFETPNELALALLDEDPAQRRRAQEAMESIQHVRDSYAGWLESPAYLRARAQDLFFVGFQETLDRDFETLKRRLGVSSHAQLPRDEVSAHKNPGHLDTTLDDAARAAIERHYAGDYELITLCRQIMACQ